MPTNITQDNTNLRMLLSNDRQQKVDIMTISSYVKDDLFFRSPFVFEEAMEVGGMFHKDFKDNCRCMLADGKLMEMSEDAAFTYMDSLWKQMGKKMYKSWMAMKRSNAYQAVQFRFEGAFPFVFLLHHYLYSSNVIFQNYANTLKNLALCFQVWKLS